MDWVSGETSIRILKKRFHGRWLGVLLVFVASGLPGCASRSQEKGVPPTELKLGYDAFDQSLGGGWRAISDKRHYLEAARLIDRYEREKPGLAEWQHVNLLFHAGQLYAFAGRTKLALARFRKALYAHEPEASPIRWNAYVRATIAFLEHDRGALIRYRDEIAQGPKVNGAVPNLEVVDRFIAHFGESYEAAYRGNTAR